VNVSTVIAPPENQWVNHRSFVVRFPPCGWLSKFTIW
jgi:hypothetical protein